MFNKWFKTNINELTTEYLLETQQIDLSDCEVHLPRKQYEGLRQWALNKRINTK